jgi:predicted lipoprotein
LLSLAAGPALAQSDWARMAVPFYSPSAVLQGLYGHWALPRAQDFVREAQALAAALADCGLAREPWRRTLLAWERLSAVATGPLITRRSARAIDFQPTRPALIQRALAAGPGWDLALVGAPAKGLPALEWLLWTGPKGRTACVYAQALAAELVAEAQALQQGFAALATQEWGEDKGPAAIAEFVNQWVGGLERLRWTGMEKPLRAQRPAELPRALSGSTAAAWAARWEGLRALTVFSGGAAPAPGQGLVPLEAWLRGRGLNPTADALRQAVQRSDAALRGLQPTGPVLAAAAGLARLKRLAEEQVAPALDVRLGFSDADGD